MWTSYAIAIISCVRLFIARLDQTFGMSWASFFVATVKTHGNAVENSRNVSISNRLQSVRDKIVEVSLSLQWKEGENTKKTSACDPQITLRAWKCVSPLILCLICMELRCQSSQKKDHRDIIDILSIPPPVRVHFVIPFNKHVTIHIYNQEENTQRENH